MKPETKPMYVIDYKKGSFLAAALFGLPLLLSVLAIYLAIFFGFDFGIALPFIVANILILLVFFMAILLLTYFSWERIEFYDNRVTLCYRNRIEEIMLLNIAGYKLPTNTPRSPLVSFISKKDDSVLFSIDQDHLKDYDAELWLKDHLEEIVDLPPDL